MKVVIDIPEIPTNDKQRWALSNGTPYAHGTWGVWGADCSNCGRHSDYRTPFCAWCGADMRGEAE